MKAIRVAGAGGPEVLRLEDVPEPEPGGGEALVRLTVVGVNFIDVYQRAGAYKMTHPFTPGTEGSGTVVAVGSGVTSVRVGDRVASSDLRGAYAELALAAADRLVPVPDGVELRTAGAVMLQGLTAHYLSHSTHPLARDEWCLVHAAAGGVGLLLCQMASRLGARVIGTVSTAEKETLAREAGAEEVIRYTERPFPDEVRRITDGAGVRVVYDSVGRATFDGSLDSLQRRGLMALFGQSSGAVPQFDPQVLNRKGSLFLTRPTVAHYVATRDELMSRAGDLFAWIVQGSLRVRAKHDWPLAEAGAAHAALEARQTTGKVLLLP
jgi:NADPH2:quinone reductase